jgi:predicted NBD/HSP70 family sugar kinase
MGDLTDGLKEGLDLVLDAVVDEVRYADDGCTVRYSVSVTAPVVVNNGQLAAAANGQRLLREISTYSAFLAYI